MPCLLQCKMAELMLCAGCAAPGAQLQCPTCRELGLPATVFCGQPCFKASWKKHKKVHSNPPECTLDSMSPQDYLMFSFTGPLRPGKLSPKRSLPKHIERPDYADHPQVELGPCGSEGWQALTFACNAI